MSPENVDMFWRSIEAFNAWDFEAATEVITDDFEFAPFVAAVIETTSYRGVEGLRQYRRDAEAVWQRIEIRVDSTRELGGRLMAFGELRGRGKESGLEIQAPVTFLVDFREGKLSALRAYQTVTEALEAAGLSE